MWWWIVGCLTAAGLALASVRYRRRRAERVRIDRIRAAVDRSLSAALTPADEVAASPSSAGPHTPDGTTAPEPPTESSLSPVASPRQAPQTGCAVRSRRRVVLSTNDLNKILEPGWRLS